MEVELLSTAERTLLPGVRGVLASADEALLCVAFAHPRGVHLVEKELKQLGEAARLLVTTTFDQTGGAALALAATAGVHVSTLNPGSGSTYHPKVYLGRAGRRLAAVVGSANLTGGLVTNVECAVHLRGTRADATLAHLWDWAEALWDDARAEPWLAHAAEASGDEDLEPALLAAIDAERRRDPVFLTLGARSAPNHVVEVTRSGVLVETARSQERRAGPQLIPAWMFNLAWDALRAAGSLSNKRLLEELRVHRSSAVCAILARVPGVRPLPGPGVALTLSP